MADVAQAVVPGHVTGFFTVDQDPDPTKAGSRGAGLCLAEGVTVTVRHAEQPDVTLNGEPVDLAAVDRVLRTLEVPAQVRAVTDLPLGRGLGVSGAMALGTALAANEAFDRRLSENELLTIAHGAEVQAGTGLGDAVAQARGGVPIRLEPGGPQDNALDGIPARRRVEVHAMGSLSTEDVLAGDTDRLTAPGKQALSDVVREPTLATLFESSRVFAREAELVTESVHSVIDDVAEVGGSATMAMLGETVVALDTGLTDAGYDPLVTRIDPTGATVQHLIE